LVVKKINKKIIPKIFEIFKTNTKFPKFLIKKEYTFFSIFCGVKEQSLRLKSLILHSFG